MKTLLLLSILFSFRVPAQTEDFSEITARVTQLENFHEVMYPIWHTAYPAKDINVLKNYIEEVNLLAEKIYEAELPGILRDKKDAWIKAVDQFRISVEDYNSSVEADDGTQLLNAVEKLHTDYERLVRIIRPVLKEIDEFHKVLYIIYHKYLPEKDFTSVLALSDDLIFKAEAITNAKIPARLQKKQEDFISVSADLLAAVKILKENLTDPEFKYAEESIDKVHNNYQKLEEIFN